MSVKFKFVGEDYFDSFKDEPVQYTRKSIDFQKSDLTFNDFSKSFQLPATDTNNRLFQHYYDPSIIGGFNPFQNNKAEMWVNSDLLSTGNLTLIDIDLVDGKPRQYTVQFYSDTINLKDALQDKGLNQLQWTGLDHSLTAANALTYLSGTVVPGTNLRYPMASTSNFWSWEGFAGVPGVREIRSTKAGILNREIRPSIPVSDVLDQIFADAGFDYEVDFAGNDYYDDLYMWIANGKPFISDQQQIASAAMSYNFIADTTARRLLYQKEQVNDLKMYSTITGVTTISNAAAIAYSLVTNFFIRDLGSVIPQWRYVINGVPGAWITIVAGEVTTALGALSSGDEVYIEVNAVAGGGDSFIVRKDSYFRIENTSASAIDYFTTAAYMPTMKCVDFLNGILVTFNAVMYFDLYDNKFYIKHREDWFNSGKEVDVTKEVDTSKSKIQPPTFYKQYGFTFAEGEDFLNLNYKDTNGRTYGGAFYDTGLYAGDVYENQNPFTPTIWTEVIQQNPNGSIAVSSNVAAFFSVDRGFDKVDPGVRLMYYNGSNVASGTWKVVDVNGASAGNGTTYNFFTGYESTDKVNLAYNEELDFKASGGVLIQDSLYTNFFETYVQQIYNPDVRRLSIDAYIPYNKLKTIEVNDTLIISGVKYLIDSMKVDLTTNKAKLDLINKV